MKKILLLSILLILIFTTNALAVNSWYAAAATPSTAVNMNTAGTWVPTSTGTCTGSGTALTWNNQTAGDIFYANGCTAITVNVDPQGTNAGKGKVVLTTTAGAGTAGGNFLYATAANITITSDITAGTTVGLSVSGSTGGGIIAGNVTGSATTNSQYGVSSTHTNVTLYINGIATGGGGGASSRGYYSNTASPVQITSCVGTKSSGCYTGSASAVVTVTGSCIGSSTDTGVPGCLSASTGTITVTGNLIYGTLGPPIIGPVIWNPASAPGTTTQNYIAIPGPAASTLYPSIIVPVADVSSGYHYGFDGSTYYTGTLSAGGGGAWAQ
jgi:hypothetical protein